MMRTASLVERPASADGALFSSGGSIQAETRQLASKNAVVASSIAGTTLRRGPGARRLKETFQRQTGTML